MRLIKKLTKDELAEGLTPEFINSVNLDKCCSPVQMEPGDEPVKVLRTPTGYSIIVGVYNDGRHEKPIMLKDANEKQIVFRRRKIHVARARYLMNFDQKDRTRKVRYIVQQCKVELLQQIIKTEGEISRLEARITQCVAERLMQRSNGFSGAIDTHDASQKLTRLTKMYNLAKMMWEQRDYIGLYTYLSQYFRFPSFESLIVPFIDSMTDHPRLKQVVRNIVHKEHSVYFHTITKHTNVTKSEHLEAGH